LLKAHSGGDKEALAKLMPNVYQQLHAMASAKMSREKSNHTLQPTALVHEVFLRFINTKELSINDRVHFFAFAANTMRRVLVDHARAKNAHKRQGGQIAVSFDEAIHAGGMADPNIIELDDVLNELAKINERQSRVVELKYFGGLSIEETAQALDCSLDTVKRDWKKAKLWLYHALKKT
jgi:RNA polymerase sigma-70 factor (ECF subfamily)